MARRAIARRRASTHAPTPRRSALRPARSRRRGRAHRVGRVLRWAQHARARVGIGARRDGHAADQRAPLRGAAASASVAHLDHPCDALVERRLDEAAACLSQIAKVDACGALRRIRSRVARRRAAVGFARAARAAGERERERECGERSHGHGFSCWSSQHGGSGSACSGSECGWARFAKNPPPATPPGLLALLERDVDRRALGDDRQRHAGDAITARRSPPRVEHHPAPPHAGACHPPPHSAAPAWSRVERPTDDS